MLEGSGKEVTTNRMVEAIMKGHAEVHDMFQLICITKFNVTFLVRED